MATVILVRHGRTSANATGDLAGRSPGMHLDDLGRTQADRAGQRLASVPLVEIATSPLERTRETASAIAKAQAQAHEQASKLAVRRDKGLVECDYGDWTGRPLKELAREKLWKVVQSQPSAAAFPGGESLTEMSRRAVAAIRGRDVQIAEQYGDHAVWVAVSHGDIIKAVLADALGMHLDLFQRIQVDPASISVIRFSQDRPYVLATNTHDGELSWLKPPTKGHRRRASSGAQVGGGSGPAH